MVQRKVISSHKHSNERLSYDHAHLNTFEKVNFRLPCVFGNFSSAVLYGRSSSRERKRQQTGFCADLEVIRYLRLSGTKANTKIALFSSTHPHSNPSSSPFFEKEISCFRFGAQLMGCQRLFHYSSNKHITYVFCFHF